MQFRVRISRIIHHTIRYKWLKVPRPCLKHGVGIEELCGFRLTPLQCSLEFPDATPQEDDAKFFEFSKRAEDGPSRVSKLSKTFPELPTKFRVSSSNPESRLSIPLGLGIFKGWLERVMLQSSSLCQDRKILLRLSKNSPCSANPEFQSRADSQ